VSCNAGESDCDCVKVSSLVTECKSGGYSAKSCRLYPNSEALSCESKASSDNAVTEKGLYGYCLENDPKNPSVCLLWYPTDNVRSSQAGEAPQSALPDLYYCSQVDLNIELVEHREAFDQGYYYHGAVDDTFNWARCQDGGRNSIDNGDINNCKSRCAGTVNDYTGFLWISSSDNSCQECICMPAEKGDKAILEDRSFTFQNVSHKYDPAMVGWFIYNGSQGHDSNVRVLDYGINKQQCEDLGSSAKWFDNCSDDSAYDCLQAKYKGSDNFGACLMSTYDYKLKCGAYAKGEIPWVNRVKNPSVSKPNDPYVSTEPYYPFASSTYWGGMASIPSDNTLVGSAFGCKDKRDLDYSNYCQYLRSSNKGVYLDPNVKNNNTLSNVLFPIAQYNYPDIGAIDTKTLDSKLFWGMDDLNNSANGYPVPSPILTAGTNTADPTIDSNSIKVYDPTGKVISASPGTGNYAVKTGVNTLTFGVTIDKERTPIKKMTIDFGDGADKKIVWTNIDASTKFTFVHRYTSDMSAQIVIGVEDNWGAVKCSDNSTDCTIK